jgi:hypothetical protein
MVSVLNARSAAAIFMTMPSRLAAEAQGAPLSVRAPPEQRQNDAIDLEQIPQHDRFRSSWRLGSDFYQIQAFQTPL